METKMLHFTVNPNILNIIRQAYWFEEGRKDWAMRCMHTLDGSGKMTLDTVMNLLNGKNGLTTTDGGETLELTNKQDKEFIKELKEWKELQKRKEDEKKIKEREGLEERESRTGQIRKDVDELGQKFLLPKPKSVRQETAEMATRMMDMTEIVDDNIKTAKKKDDKCKASKCPHCIDNKCCFGKRDNWGCYGKDKLVRNKLAEFKMLSMGALRVGEKGLKSLDYFAGKIFNFVYKGHHYTIKDSARSQSHCPHCDTNSKGYIWDKKDDKEAFIGYKSFGKSKGMLGKMENFYAVCFECPKCFEKFFYHDNYKK